MFVPRAPNGMPLANFGDRFVAYLIDAAVLFAVNLVLAIPVFIGIIAVIASAASNNSTNASVFIGVPLLIELGYILAIVAVVYVYHVEMFGRTGITWGKRAMKLQIIRTDNPALPVDRGVLLKRWAVQFAVGIVVPFFSWVDNLWLLWDKPYQQCLHDKAAGTIVVKAG
ncbi:RDD family protein [Dactylosporangium salmoneum]|uniref:RDD domain-containing protein n=1 Tax=Dactylosporangium salmoneum TaxID=53361 RepID=A0ABN3HC50_9ACTN